MKTMPCARTAARLLGWCLGGALAGPAAAQVFKCTVDGATVYQARPCATAGGTGQEVKLHVAPVATPAAPATPPPAAKPAATPEQPAPSPTQAMPSAPQKTQLEAEAEACLDWYRPKLRDPRSAYYRNPTKDRSVLTITVYGTSGRGGYLSQSAACEIKGGSVDDGWTKIHAERLGWVLARCGQVVVPVVPVMPLGATLPQVGPVHRARQAAESMLLGCEP